MTYEYVDIPAKITYAFQSFVKVLHLNKLNFLVNNFIDSQQKGKLFLIQVRMNSMSI